MLDKLNNKYGLILGTVILVELMLIFGSGYRESYPDAELTLTYKEQAEKGYQEWLKHLKIQKDIADFERSKRKGPTAFEKRLMDSGLVNVQDIDPDIMVGLRYSSKNNFLGKDLYGDLDNCYLQKEVAEKLALASKYLHEKHPYYNLKVLDGVRPLHIQRMMWDSLKMSPEQKLKYVSPPTSGSLHNYGAAVDITLVNYEGWELDMGTDFDYFGELGHPSAEGKMVSEGKLTHRQLENRKLLRDVMYRAGFTGLGTEWWHFNACGLDEARSKYRIIQ